MLELDSNEFNEIDWMNLPPTLTELRLNHNQLTTVGDVSHFTQLKVLSLNWNQMSEVGWGNLPPTLAGLGLFDNPLTTVGDITHCTNLNSKFHTIHSLPKHYISIKTGSSVKVLGQKCFNEHTYSKLKERCQSLSWKLEKPPIEVLLQGLEAVLEYYKENTVRTTQSR